MAKKSPHITAFQRLATAPCPEPAGLDASSLVERIGGHIDVGRRCEALALIDVLQAALTLQPTPAASRLFTAVRAWESAVCSIDMTEEHLEDGASVDQLVSLWELEQQTRAQVRSAAAGA